MAWNTEFPEIETDVGTLAAMLPDGFVDVSWHNDCCPSFQKTLKNGLLLRVWIDFADKDCREIGGGLYGNRFIVEILNADYEHVELLLSTEVWADALASIDQVLKGD